MTDGGVSDGTNAKLRWRLAVPVALALFVCLAGCSSDVRGIGNDNSLTVATRAPNRASWEVSADVLNGQPAQLVPDPSGHAIWWWGIGGDGNARVYRFGTLSHQLSSWSLGNDQKIGLVTGEDSGIALGAPGIVWVGASMRLARLDTVTGAVDLINVPKVPASKQMNEYRPPQMAGSTAIVALAANTSGDVVVVTTPSTEIPIYHSSTNQFSFLELPSNREANDAAYLPDGTLGVALQHPAGPPRDEVQLVSPGGKTTIANGVQAAFIIPDGDRFLVGEEALFWVYPNGTDSHGTGSEASEPWLAFPSTHPTWPTAEGHVVSLAIEDEGLVDLSADGPAENIVLARRPCYTGPSMIGGPGPLAPGTTRADEPTSTTVPPVCHTDVASLTAVGNQVWYLETFKQHTYVWRVGTASY